MEKKHIVFVESLNFGWVVSEQALRRLQAESKKCRIEWLSAMITECRASDLENSLP